MARPARRDHRATGYARSPSPLLQFHSCSCEKSKALGSIAFVSTKLAYRWIESSSPPCVGFVSEDVFTAEAERNLVVEVKCSKLRLVIEVLIEVFDLTETRLMS